MKIILFFFLWSLFATSLRAFRLKFASASTFVRYMIPVAVAIFAIILGYQIYKNIMDLREMNREMRERRKNL